MLQRFELAAEIVEFLEGHGVLRNRFGGERIPTRQSWRHPRLVHPAVRQPALPSPCCSDQLPGDTEAGDNNDCEHPCRAGGALHLYFIYLEMVAWDTPAGRGQGLWPRRRRFRHRVKDAGRQPGLYNGLIAAGLLWGHLPGDAGFQVKAFFPSASSSPALRWDNRQPQDPRSSRRCRRWSTLVAWLVAGGRTGIHRTAANRDARRPPVNERKASGARRIARVAMIIRSRTFTCAFS